MLPLPSRLLQRQMKARKISSSERLQTDQDDPELCRNPPVHLCPRHAPFLSRFYDLKQLLQLNSCRLLWVTKVWKFSWNFPHCKVPANWLELIKFPLIKFLVVIGTLMTGNVWVYHIDQSPSVNALCHCHKSVKYKELDFCSTTVHQPVWEREGKQWVLGCLVIIHGTHQSPVRGVRISDWTNQIRNNSLFTLFTLDYSWFFYFFESWMHWIEWRST